MPTTRDLLHARLQPAFDRLVAGSDPVVRPSDKADYQSNGVMAVAKSLGRPPREVAEEIVAHADLAGLASVDVAGPGFLNLTLSDEFLSSRLRDLTTDDRLGVARRDEPGVVVIDYSAPNVAKEMHVGHLRSTVIGDSLSRLFTFLGDDVVARNHIGDWGTPFGMLIEHLLDLGEDSAISELAIGDLNSFYKAARVKFDEDETFAERSRQRVVLLQGGDSETRRLWRILVDQSVAYFQEVYAKLDVLLTPADAVGESYYNDMLADVVADLDAAGLLTESDGAKVVFPEGFVNREGEPLPVIVQKKDDGFGYAATDLAAVRDRVVNLRGRDLLYVVGAPQAQHFQMVWSVARMAGWLPDNVHIEHVSFGNVLGPDRKIFKTRSGDTVKLVSLLDEAIAAADTALRARGSQLAEDERLVLATQIARAAVKYADLSTERQRDYVFDLERMIAFEGDTGPYLAYAHARIRSIFRRLGDEPWSAPARLALTEPSARHLALGLLRFPEAIDEFTLGLAPHKLCVYLFDLAQRFTSFYENCPVLSSDGEVRAERLTLCAVTASTLSLGLSLLGIEAPEQM